MNSTFEILKGIQYLFNELKLDRNKNWQEFEFLISDKNLTILDYARLNYSVPFDGFKINEVDYPFEELKKFQNSSAVAYFNSKYFIQNKIEVYQNWDSYLNDKANLTKVPEEFLIISDNEIYQKKDPNTQNFNNYLNIIRVISHLTKAADHTESIGENLDKIFFLHKTKLQISLNLKEKQISSSLDGISILDSLLSDSHHKDQKITILKEALLGILSNIDTKDRLSYLFDNFGEFTTRFSENYNYFVSEFSFDKVRKEYEEKKREYLTKLNEIFSSVHTQLLGIPISLAVAALKISDANNGNTFFTNSLIFVSIFIYGIMVISLLNNQSHSLNSVKSDYHSQISRLSSQYPIQYNSIRQIEKELNSRFTFHQKTIKSYKIITYFIASITFILYTYYLPWETIRFYSNRLINDFMLLYSIIKCDGV